MYVIETKKLKKNFNSFTAVNGISLRVDEGEIFGLLGPNGAGKTTTLSMLATLIKPTSGSASVNGYDVLKHASQVRKSIGFVFQDPSCDDQLSGRDNLYLHALMYGVNMKDIGKKINGVLRMVDLERRQHELVRHYSGGMRRRLELARGLLHEPKILFLDEPTLGLDPQTRIHMWSYIKKLSTEGRVTIIITTHYMEEAEELCDRIAIIDRGKIILLGKPNELKKKLGGDIITVKTKEKTLAKIKRLKYVKKAEATKDGMRIVVDNANERLQEILKVLGKVESVTYKSPTLNDVFLFYTGHQIRDSEAEGGWFDRMVQSQSRARS